MRLAAAARHFDRLVCADAYDPLTTFKGQFGLFDDSMRDGLTVERRVLSTAPEVTLPARRAVTADGATWLLGDRQADYFKTRAIRYKYVAHVAEELVQAKTIEEALSGAAGYAAWSSRVWLKTSKEIEISSDMTNVFDLYFAKGEPLAEGTLILMSNRWHLVRSLYPSASGFLVALSDELPEPVLTTASFEQRVYQRATDSYSTTPTTVPALRIRWQSYFRYPSRGSDKFTAGDTVLAVLKSAVTVKAGDAVTVGGTNFTVNAVFDEGAVWTAHLRHA